MWLIAGKRASVSWNLENLPRCLLSWKDYMHLGVLSVRHFWSLLGGTIWRAFACCSPGELAH